MAFYKNILVCKRELMQLQESLIKISSPVVEAAAAPRVKHLCYRCGFYFEGQSTLDAHPCHQQETKCPHCLYRFRPSQAQPNLRATRQAQAANHQCKVCRYCKNVYTVSDEQHLRICDGQFVTCTDCRQKIPRNLYRQHRNDCIFCRCYKCGVAVYKRLLAEHLINCCKPATPTHRFQRKTAAQPFHFYHFKNKRDSIPSRRVVVE